MAAGSHDVILQGKKENAAEEGETRSGRMHRSNRPELAARAFVLARASCGNPVTKLMLDLCNSQALPQ